MWAEETWGKPEGIILSPHLGPQFWPQKEAGEAQYREIRNWRVIRTWPQNLIRVPALQVRAKYQLFSKQGFVNDPCIKQAKSLLCDPPSGKSAQPSASKARATLHLSSALYIMSAQHLLPVLDTCESFQSSVWHFGSTWQTEDTICMKFTYIKVGGDHETPFGRKARKSSRGWIFLKLKGLVMDGKQDFLLLRRKKFCDLEPLWTVGHGNADNFQRRIDCTSIMLLTLGLTSLWDSRKKMHSKAQGLDF